MLFAGAQYPNFTAFLAALKVPTHAVALAMSVGGAARAVRPGVPRWRDMLDGGAWACMYDAARFGGAARALLVVDSDGPELTVGELVKREGFSSAFVRDYLDVRWPLSPPLRLC
jgi:predicted NAD/FAD-binding protein